MEKLFNILIILMISSTAGIAQHNLTVTVQNIKELKGNVRIGLFTSEKDFLKKPLDGKVVKADAKSVTVVFNNLPAGDYAVSVIHDENGNEDLDTNAFGPPSWEKSKVTLNKDETQVINMRYF
jgi:uncharacterized protein (DUF2141 family)